MRAEDPVHFSERLGAWMVTRYDDVDRTFRDPTFSSDRTKANEVQGHAVDDAVDLERPARVHDDPRRHHRRR